MKSDVSVVGLGAMGVALAGAFMNDGYSTTVRNRSATKAVELVAKGAIRADTGDYTSKEANLAMQAANDTITQVSNSQGVSAELFAPLQALMERRVAGGHGGDDFPSLIELIRQRPAA